MQGEWVFRFIILLTHRCIHFFVPSVQAYFLGSNYCIWKSSKSLKTRLSPSTNWFRLFCFHEDPALPKKEQYLLFWMEIQNLEGRTKCVNAEKRAHFHFQLHVLLSIYIPFPCTQHTYFYLYIPFPSTQHTYFYQYTSLSPLRSTRTSINMHPLPLYAAHVLLSIYIPFRSTQHTLWKVSDLVYDVFFSRILKIWAL